VRWLAVTAALDIIVPGPRSVPAHADVETITVDGVGHLGMLMSRRVVGYIVAALPAHGSPVEAEPHMRRLPTPAGQAATAS
jgi:triacylglycerol lipase